MPAKITFSESLTVASWQKNYTVNLQKSLKSYFYLVSWQQLTKNLDKDAIELIAGEYGVEVEEEIKVDITDLEVYFYGG